MGAVTLEQVNRNVMAIKQELDVIRAYTEEENMELSGETKKQIEESRKRPLSEMIPYKEIEKKFLRASRPGISL
ncbi:MAG: hypothetical protein HY518_02550 [Candidatus Aenigmarchaeota archaeon]|nr:hypothetical protein [Candidatus Aenigmarchaeota archaeon]